MAKRDAAAEAISRVAALKAVTDPAALATGLAPLLTDKSNYVVARAAEIAGERDVRAVLPQVLAAFDRFLQAPTNADPSCSAKLALARTLVKFEADRDAEDAMLRGVHHTHWETAWGGSADLAVSVRGNCAIGLAAMASRETVRCATELLAEEDLKMPRERVSWPARVDAARALTMTGTEAAAAVLRFKALVGDVEANVLSECLAGVIAIDRDTDEGLKFAERFLSLSARPGEDADASAEAALVAIGGSRRPSAFSILERHANNFLLSSSSRTYLASIALTRTEPAIDYLMKLVATGAESTSSAAMDALEPLLALPRVSDRLKAAIAERAKRR